MKSFLLRRYALLLPALTLALAAFQPLYAQPRPTGPVRTAVVNIETVMERYQKRVDYETQLRELAGRHQADITARQEHLETLQNRARTMLPHEVEQRRRLIDEYTRKQVELEVHAQMLELRHRRQFVTLFREVRGDIQRAAADVARESNFDIVMTASSEDPETTDPQNFDFNLSDKVLYYSDAIDITDAVLTRLNKHYRTQ